MVTPVLKRGLNQIDIAAFRRDGYLLVRSMWSEERVRAIRLAVARVLASGANETGVRVLAPERVLPDLLRFCTEDPMRLAVRTIIGPRVEFLSVKPVVKTSRITAASPWHQDWPYWKGSHKVSAWVALDQAEISNGCLRIVAGSHVRAWVHHRNDGPNGFGNRISEEDVIAAFGSGALRSMLMAPGDVLFFHDQLLHSSHPNRTGSDRWSLIPTYRDASVPDNHTLLKLWRAPITLG